MTNRCPAPYKNIAGLVLVLRLLTVRITEFFCQLLQLPIQIQRGYCYGFPVHHLSIAVGVDRYRYRYIYIIILSYHHIITTLSSSCHYMCSPLVHHIFQIYLSNWHWQSSFVCNSRWRVSIASGDPKLSDARRCRVGAVSPNVPQLPASSVPGVSRSPAPLP